MPRANLSALNCIDMSAITTELTELLKSAGASGPYDLSTPPKPELGDFAFACFTTAKEIGKSPVDVAVTLAEELQSKKSNLIDRVQAFGPYINFFLDSKKIVSTTVEAIEKSGDFFGEVASGNGKSVLLEYPSNNTHKEFHIGHFRNVCIGNVLANLYKKCGYEVHVINYLNDFGAHVAKCLWGLQKFHADEVPPANKQKWLGDIYAEASNYIKENPEVEEEVADLQKKLEAHDQSVWGIFEETRQWSIDKFNELFAELGVVHEAVFYEKDIKADGQDIVDELLKKGVAEVGEGGAIIINLERYGLDIALVRKSNGTGLYLTSDLPLATVKFKRFNVDESIIITGQEQNHYFRQLYKILELLGETRKLTHIGYGLIALPSGKKMSSRSGGAILYENVRDDVVEILIKETAARHPDWTNDQVVKTAKTLALGALKFDIQKHEAAKNTVFNAEEAAGFEGFTAPYVLYVIARVNSLVKKAGARVGSIEYGDSIEEKQLAVGLLGFEAAIKKAFESYNPSVIVRYVFEVAQLFNGFYNKHHVLDDQNPALSAGRLALAKATQKVLRLALQILTIDTVEEM